MLHPTNTETSIILSTLIYKHYIDTGLLINFYFRPNNKYHKKKMLYPQIIFIKTNYKVK